MGYRTRLPRWDFIDDQSGVGGSASACSVLERLSESLVPSGEGEGGFNLFALIYFYLVNEI